MNARSEYIKLALAGVILAIAGLAAFSPWFPRGEALQQLTEASKSSNASQQTQSVPAAPTAAKTAAGLRESAEANSDWDYIDGVKHYDAERYTEAIECFDKAIKSNRKNSYAYHKRGLAFQELKKLDKSLEDFNEAIKLNPANEAFYDSQIDVLREQGKFDQAIAAAELIIKNCGDSASARQSIALTCYKKKDYKKALEVLKEATRLAPKDAYNSHLSGLCHAELQMIDAAMSDYNRAIGLNDQDVDSLNNRGVIYLDRKNFQKAFEDFDRIIKLGKGEGRTYYNRSLTYTALGKNDLAQADLKKAKSMNYDPASNDYK